MDLYAAFPELSCSVSLSRVSLISSIFPFFLSKQGTVVLVFQPAEEGGGGAKKILDTGALENVSAIFGLHVTPKLPIGEVASRSGPLLAGSGFFEAVISGKGGHAAIPQHSIDPILAASNVIVSLQHLVSREADPLDSQVNMLDFFLSLLPATHLGFILFLYYTKINKFVPYSES